MEEKMTEEKILTKHPLGKSGRNITKRKYETIKQALLGALRNKELTHTDLLSQVHGDLVDVHTHRHVDLSKA